MFQYIYICKDGFGDVPLTSVFGAYILSGTPFVDTPGAMVQTFISDVVQKFGSRWVFTLNIYPYFQPSNALDPGSSDKCSIALSADLCFLSGCNLPSTIVAMRQRMSTLGFSHNVSAFSNRGCLDLALSAFGLERLAGRLLKSPTQSTCNDSHLSTPRSIV